MPKESTGVIYPDATYPIDKAAQFCGVNLRDFRDIIKRGEFPAARISRTAILIPGWVIIRWVEENMTWWDEDGPTEKPVSK